MRNRKPKRAAIYGLASLAWIGVLFFFSGQSGVESGELSGWLTQKLFGEWIARGADALMLEHLLRKAAHFGIFAVMGFLAGMTFLHLLRRRTAVCIALMASAGLAVSNELHQRLSDARTCSVTDMAIDAGGAALGLLVAVLMLWLCGYWRDRTKKGHTGDLK